jgi:hypothetical protein
MISGPLIRKKKAPVSLATAFAIRVFPEPGGPNRSTPLGGFNAKSLEEFRVSKGQLDHLSDLGHLTTASSDIIVAYFIPFLLILTLYRLSLAMNLRVRGANTIR